MDGRAVFAVDVGVGAGTAAAPGAGVGVGAAMFSVMSALTLFGSGEFGIEGGLCWTGVSVLPIGLPSDILYSLRILDSCSLAFIRIF